MNLIVLLFTSILWFVLFELIHPIILLFAIILWVAVLVIWWESGAVSGLLTCYLLIAASMGIIVGFTLVNLDPIIKYLVIFFAR